VQRRSNISAPLVARACAVLATVVAVVTLVGIATDERILTRFASDVAPVQVNTSIALVAAALALWLLSGSSSVGRRIGAVAAILTGLVGLAALLEYVFDVSFGIDELVASDPLGGDFPGRMSPQMALALVLVATALLCALRAPRASQLAAGGALITSYAAFVSIAFEIPRFFGMTGVPGMSIPGALGVALLAIGVFALRPDAGITRLLISRSRGGRLARIGLLGALGASLLFGIVIHAAHKDLHVVSSDVVASVYFLGSGVFAACLVLAVGYSYDRVDRARAVATEGLLVSEQQSRALIDHAAEAITVLDLEANRFVRVNPAAERMFGLTASELTHTDPDDLSPPEQPDGRISALVSAEHIEAAVRGETPVFDWVHRHVSGRPIDCEVRLLRLPHPDRTLIRC
jgi:PAS domain S-box-containing protein